MLIIKRFKNNFQKCLKSFFWMEALVDVVLGEIVEILTI